MSTLTSERRNDLHLTSTGVALARRHSEPLDTLLLTKPLHSSLPLPPLLSPPATNNIYQTTTATAYDKKDLTPFPLYKKAPGHWRVNYTLEAINRMSSKPWRRPLTMSNQMSETRAQFSGQPELISRVLPDNDPQPPSLRDHFIDGVTKELVPSTTVNRRVGQELSATTGGVLSCNQPYLTTNNRFHRRYSAPEQLGYARKDVATYWLCEDYPKAWGHGTKVNPLTTPTCRSERGTMRDRTVFRTGTNVVILPSSLKPLSQANKTVYGDVYRGFEEEERKTLFHCPVQPQEKLTAANWSS
jgi:hypothetical protein